MTGVPAGALFTTHRGQTGNEGLSPRIWDPFYRASMAPGGGQAVTPASLFDNFTNFADVSPAIAGATSGVSGGFATFQSTATTTSYARQIADEDGVIELGCGATAHHSVTVQAGGLTGGFFRIAGNRGSYLRGFEARVKVPTGTTSAVQGVFVGVAAAGNAAINFMANTTMALKDTNLIGFHFPVGSSNVIKPVWRKSGVAVVEPATETISYTPGSWIKLGFLYDSSAQPREACTFFVNNRRVAVVSQADVDALMPINQTMSPILSVKALTTTAAFLQCDFIGAYKM
jgi:hypothetical protein